MDISAITMAKNCTDFKKIQVPLVIFMPHQKVGIYKKKKNGPVALFGYYMLKLVDQCYQSYCIKINKIRLSAVVWASLKKPRALYIEKQTISITFDGHIFCPFPMHSLSLQEVNIYNT